MRGEVIVVRGDTAIPENYEASIGLRGDAAALERAVSYLTHGWAAPGRFVLLVQDEEDRPVDAELTAASETRPGPVWENRLAGLLDRLGEGATRSGAEREVPLDIWRTETFRRWYAVQRAAGNTLLGARTRWVSRTRDGRLFFWALHVRVHVAAEQRVKGNEVVLSRPDTFMVVLYRRAARFDDTLLVLVREFRSAASVPGGFTYDLPGGSGRADADPVSVAHAELLEDTGLEIASHRLRPHGHRPVAATFSVQHAHLWSAELTEDETAVLRSRGSGPWGLVKSGELTWPELVTFGEVRSGRLVDWPTLGMIAQALTEGEDA